MSNQDKNDNIKIIYKSKDKRIKIFHINFVKNNRDKCKIIYKDKEYELQQYFNFNDNDKNIYFQ